MGSGPDHAPTGEFQALRELCSLYGIESSFWDGLGGWREAPVESILAVLRALGAPLHDLRDCADAITSHNEALWNRLVEPVVVFWEGRENQLQMRLLAEEAEHPIEVLFRLETGETLSTTLGPGEGSILQAVADRQLKSFSCSQSLPLGYHGIEIATRFRQSECTLVQAPWAAYGVTDSERCWGLFVPAYALHSERTWGVGDFSVLADFVDWVGAQGGRFVGTLPLFAAFLDEPFDPSPYAPVSRLFWNELYVDPTALPNWDYSVRIRELMASEAMQRDLRSLRTAAEVDYKLAMKTKRAVLELLSEEFFRYGKDNLPDFRQFVEEQPKLRRYATFRARLETVAEIGREGLPGHNRFRESDLAESLDRTVRYHLFAQWVAQQQVEQVLDRAKLTQTGLYLDLPLGVHPRGFDAWNDASVFASGVAGGSPPDGFFTGGQNWGFSPVHPLASRSQAHRYLRECFNFLLSRTDLVRIDHAMSLHRLYWVPDGMPATEGVYVHYPSSELYAILSLESHRNRCVVIGEDLGTTLPEIRADMTSHNIQRMYVGIFELRLDSDPPFNEVPDAVAASLNTHDTPTFAGYWSGRDITERARMGLLDADKFRDETEYRAGVRRALSGFFGVEDSEDESDQMLRVMHGWTEWIAGSPARFLMLSLEDLWLEINPQNVPGTGPERPNWRQKCRFSLGELCTNRPLLDTLQRVHEKREGTISKPKEEG